MIQSNTSTPSTRATAIAGASAGIMNGGSITKDTSSKISGYSQLNDAISKEQEQANTIANQLEQFISLIQSVASEFQTVDYMMSQQIVANQSHFLPVENGSLIKQVGGNKGQVGSLEPSYLAQSHQSNTWNTALPAIGSQKDSSLFSK